MSSSNWPVKSRSPYWGDPVASSATLPATGQVTGEIRLVLDTDDLYEWNGSAWERITENSADVTGPASSTDNAIARFDGTTGKVLQNSGATVDDTGVVTAPGFVGPLTGNVTGNVSGTAANVTGVVAIANGGTNSNAALSNNRVMKSTGGAIVEAAAITAARALVSDANGIPVAATPSTTEVNYLAGVTSLIQTQLDAKLALAGGTMLGDLTLAGDPNSALKAATKQYVDSVAAGLSVKQSVLIATTANITLSGLQTIDGVLTIVGDRVLVKNQLAPAENGIYLSAVGAWTRTTDMDSWAEVPGTFVFVEQGSTYADTAWVCTADPGGTLGVTSITWSQFAGAGTYTADGQGIELTGTQFSLELDGTTLSKSASGLKVADLGLADAQIAVAAAITRSKTAAGTPNRLVYNAATTGVMTDLAAITASRALASDANGLPVASATTAAELAFVNGVTSAIQTQLDAKYAPTSVASVSSNVTLTNKRIHLVDTTSARSLALPDPASTHMFVIKDKTGTCSTNNITVTRFAAEQIEAVAASYVLDADFGSWTFVSDATNWFII